MAQLPTLHPLDKNFVTSKPRKEAPENRIALLAGRGELFQTRKRDGYGSIAVVTGDRKSPVTLYTRSINEITEKFPEVVEGIRALALPRHSVIPCELHWSFRENDTDDLNTFGRFVKSNSPKAVALQKELGSARCMFFTPLIVNRADVSVLAYKERATIVEEWFDKRTHELIFNMEHLSGSFAELQVRVSKEKWEGLVLYDANARTTFAMHGDHEKPPRPDGCWKWKPIHEDDFIATGFAPGSGKNSGLAGKIFIAQIDSRNGERVPCGEVPLHSKDHKADFAKAKYPLVVEVEYEIRTPRGALRTSSVLRVRDDKGIGECVLPEKYQR